MKIEIDFKNEYIIIQKSEDNQNKKVILEDNKQKIYNSLEIYEEPLEDLAIRGIPKDKKYFCDICNCIIRNTKANIKKHQKTIKHKFKLTTSGNIS